MAFYRDRPLGTIGHLGCYSFHETKNYTAGGEGGALVINDSSFVQRAEMIQQKGTNRSQFLRGQVDKYTWQCLGSSFLPSELQGAYLLAQLESADAINERRLQIWSRYHEALAILEDEELVRRPFVPTECRHNGHLYYLRLVSAEAARRFIERMAARGIATPAHYVPLHASPGGARYGRFSGVDRFTTTESEKLVRLPVWYNMTDTEVSTVIDATIETARAKA